MEIKNMAAVLLTADAGRSMRFYRDVLGMKVKADFGGLNYVFEEGFAVWQPMEENIIPRKLGMQNITDPCAVSRFELCFETPDIDAVYVALKRNGVKFLHEINEELWGQRTVRFYDPDGHLLEVGEELQVFVGRIYNEEKDVDATARRVYMDPAMVRGLLGL